MIIHYTVWKEYLEGESNLNVKLFILVLEVNWEVVGDHLEHIRFIISKDFN